MVLFIELMNSIREFLDTGGQVLTVIAGVICLMWLLIFERLYFFLYGYQKVKKQIVGEWLARGMKDIHGMLSRFEWPMCRVLQNY